MVALVELTVKGHPYLFLADTGALKTVVDPTVAKALALPDTGAAIGGQSLCSTSMQPVAISDWKLGGVRLPATTAFALKFKFAGVKIKGIPIAGSLGADMLARFGTVTLDTAGKRLILGGQGPTGGRIVPVKVGHGKVGGAKGEVIVAARATIHGKQVLYQIDTGAGRTTIDTRAAKRLGLRAVGRSVRSHTVICASATFTPVGLDDWSLGA